jgi:hypothetical protein
MCVPDPICPDGFYEEWVCEGGDMPVNDQSICLDPNGCPPEPGECYPMCVPVDPCGPGFHEEWACTEPVEPQMGGGMEEPSCNDPMGCPDQCYPICVPDNPCEPGYHEEWVCGPVTMEQSICLDPNGCEPGPEECYPICAPDCVVVCDEYNMCWEDCSGMGQEPGGKGGMEPQKDAQP